MSELQALMEALLQRSGHMTLLELVSVLFGLVSVWYLKQENILVYPTGIVSVTIAVYLTFAGKLYAEAAINAYYFVMSIYGWYHWLDPRAERRQIPITRNSKMENMISMAVFLVSVVVIRLGLDFTDSDVPMLDAVTTAGAITGMWLITRKKLENWIAWIITDSIATPLYFYKDMIWFSLQFLIFTILAFWGFFEWKRKMRLQAPVG